MKGHYCLALAAAFLIVAVAAARGALAAATDRQNDLTLRLQRAAAAKRAISDITHPYVARRMPNYGSPRGIPPFAVPNSDTTMGGIDFTLNTHWGTHADAPGHFNQTLLDQGYDVNRLNLTTLNGPCWVVDTPRDQNITDEVMKRLNIPRGVTRVLFRTLNTDRRLMSQPTFDSSYTAFTTDGARYLVSHTDIKLVGIDYLSMGIGEWEEVKGVHLTFLNAKDIILVEGLNLDHVAPGTAYTVNCLPLSLPKFDGSPVRCMLTTNDSSSRPSVSP
ncbi:unnamed protein product [Cuscuta campestris]|uniref:Cyclase family protein n=1 Tax=Cuscuta campestris TaxID=132261 RepID=A0A484NKI7_9ASTE|nr:unnamed protein product [Cuscuta campestris]